MTAEAVVTPSFSGRVEDGRLKLDDREAFQRWLNQFEGQDIEIKVRKRRTHRSNRANGFYWGVLIRILGEFTGFSDEELHAALKQRLLIDRTDEQLPRVRSTASLTVAEFARYVDDCVRIAAEMGCVIPDPQ